MFPAGTRSRSRDGRRRRFAGLLVVASAAFLSSAAGASGAVSEVQGGLFGLGGGSQINVDTKPGEGDVVNEVTIAVVGGDYTFVDPGGIVGTGGPPCTDATSTQVTCPMAGVSTYTSNLGAGSDRLTLSAATAFSVGQIEMGSGDDFFQGGGGMEGVTGGSGADQLLLGAGNDGENFSGVDGGAGQDVIQGEAGDDWVLGGEDPDNVDGGPDSDLLSGGSGDDVVSGGSGDDQVDDDPGPGDDSLSGGDGNDRVDALDGNDVADGGAGNDLMDAYAGTDVMVGGDGDDAIAAHGTATTTIDAGDGDDEILSFNNGALVDEITCGPGTGDEVYPGPGDVAGADCETVGEEFDCSTSLCQGEISVVAPPPPPSGDRIALAAKKKKRKPIVLGAKEFRVVGGGAVRTTTPLSGKRVTKALRKRSSVRVTRILAIEVKKPNGKTGMKRTKTRYTLLK